jgi:sialic acid synthase SpsE
MNSPYVIAEIGINHDGNKELALELIKGAAISGSNAVKFQYRNINKSYTKDNSNIEELGDALIKPEIIKNYIDPENIISLSKEAKKLNLDVGISFFSVEDVKDFCDLNFFDFFKVPSVEFDNKNLVNLLIAEEKPVYLSTGCQTEDNILKFLHEYEGFQNWKLMHCVSNYPLSSRNCKLGYLKRLQKLCKRDVGYSSHDEDWENCLVSATLGATIIERHITKDKTFKGLDHTSSSTIEEFGRMCSILKNIPLMLLGDSPRALNQGELLNKQNLGRSVYASRQVESGECLGKNSIIERCPQVGITLNELQNYKNIPLKRKLLKNEPITHSHFVETKDFETSLREGANKNLLSLPVRVHDFYNVHKKFNIKNYEFHLSFNEILNKKYLDINYPKECTYSIHLPDYIDSNNLIDPFSEDSYIKELSIRLIENTKEFAKILNDLTGKCVNIVGSFSLCNHSKEIFYIKIKEMCDEFSDSQVKLLPQWLPPVAWYFGGSVDMNIFCSTEDVSFLKENKIDICFDLCHYFMGLSANLVSETDFYDLLTLAKHLHIADSIGIDGEGIQIGQGDSRNRKFISEGLSTNNTKVLEVWQGHLNNFDGFYNSISNSLNFLS